MFNPRRNKKGFTLIELIIVIAIIAILAAVAIPSFIGITEKANQSVAIANATSLATAINTYNALNPGSEVASTDIDTYAHFSAKLGSDLAVKGLTEDTYSKALVYLDYTAKVATVKQSV